MDPLQALQAAYQVPPDSKEQEELLSKLRESLENHPNFIPVLCSGLVRTFVGAQDSLIKRWTLDLLHFGLGRANLAIDNRAVRKSNSERNASYEVLTVRCTCESVARRTGRSTSGP